MEILGIGPSELIFVVIIALIILGPKDMQKAGKTIGKWMREIITSDAWAMFQKTSRELKTLPNRLMREANDEVNKIGNELNNTTSSWMNNPNIPTRSTPIPTSPTPENPPKSINVPSEIESTPNESEEPNAS